MKILLAGTSYINTDIKYWLAQRWLQIGLTLNPTCDLLIVDSNSPIQPIIENHNPFEVEIFSWEENLGHLQSTKIDGWGRSTMKALQVAIDRNYDYVCTIDTDVIFTLPISPICKLMKTNSIKAASTRGPPYTWLEGIFFFDVLWLKEQKFIEKYSWETVNFGTFPEQHMEKIIGNYLYDLKLSGRRNDDNLVTKDNLQEIFPNGCHWLTHCNNINVYKKLLGDIID